MTRTAVGDGGVYFGYGGQDTEKGFAALSMDGKEVWTVPAESQVVGAPTVNDGTVYVTEYSAALYAIDTATGEVNWSADTGTETPATPAVADGTVYLGVQNAVQSYDAASGDRQWTFDVSGDSNFTTSAPAATDDAVFFGDSKGTLRAVESDGTERWSADVADFTSSSPAVADGTVYLAATTTGDPNTASVYAHDAADGSEVWSTGIEPSLASAPVIAGETLYVSGSMFDVHALTTDDGEQLWSSAETERGAVDLVPPPTAADDTVYVGSYDKQVYALRSE